MTTIRHAKVSGAGPAADPSKVGGDDWDADHEIIGGLLVSDPVTLTSADILALHTTPITLVPAPGAGRFFVPHLIVARTSGGTTPYTVPDAVSIQVGDASWVEVSSLFSVVTGEQVATFIPASVNYATTDVENGAITIYSSDDNPADGDGNVTFEVWYSEHSVSA